MPNLAFIENYKDMLKLSNRIVLIVTMLALSSASAKAQAGKSTKADIWVSTTAGDKKLTKEPVLRVYDDQNTAGDDVILIDPTRTFQTIDGMGSSLEPSTCYNLSKLEPAERELTLKALLSADKGIGMNLMRICIGTPDFTGDAWYSYDDLAKGETDTLLKKFSIANDEKYILPILREALRIRPDLRFFASPWSPPGWMKTSESLIGGRVKPEYYASLARYFVQFIKAYEAAGIPVFAVTVQNEPGVDRQFESPKWHYPSCHWTAEAQRDFIKNHLGPEFARNKLKTEIWCYDHNFNIKPMTDNSLVFVPEKPGDAGIGFPRTILNDPEARKYTSAMAFHGYEGRPEGMSVIQKEFQDVPVRFTEGSVFGLTGGTTLISILKNNAISYNAWVVMLDDKRKPNNGPFPASRTIIERNSTENRTVYNFDYYMYGHFMKFIPRGSRIVFSEGRKTNVHHLACINPEGKLVVVLINPSAAMADITVMQKHRFVKHKMPANSVATILW